MLSLTVELRSINNLNAPIYVNYKDRRADFERRVFALKSPLARLEKFNIASSANIKRFNIYLFNTLIRKEQKSVEQF